MPNPPSLTTVLWLFLGGALFASWLLSDLKKTTWKRLEYATVFFTAFTLVPYVVDAQHLFLDEYQKAYKEIVGTYSTRLTAYLDSTQTAICAPAIRGPAANSAENTDAVCKWLSEKRASLAGAIEKSQPINNELIEPLPSPSNNFSPTLKKMVEEYDYAFGKLESYKNQAKPGPTEGLNNVLKLLSVGWGPYSLVLALVLKVAQTHWEIKHP